MLTTFLLNLGLTRDSLWWFWGRLSSGALLLVSGLVPLDAYVSPRWKSVLTVACAVILWLSGKYDASPLPGKKP